MPYISTAERIGMEKGMKKGIDKGIHIVALNLLEQGSDVDFVTKVTKLPLDEVNRLKEDWQKDTWIDNSYQR